MNDNKMNPNARLSFLERFAYGIGDYAGNLVYSAISAFLLVYYTNVVGASAAAAASRSRAPSARAGSVSATPFGSAGRIWTRERREGQSGFASRTALAPRDSAPGAAPAIVCRTAPCAPAA